MGEVSAGTFSYLFMVSYKVYRYRIYINSFFSHGFTLGLMFDMV